MSLMSLAFAFAIGQDKKEPDPSPSDIAIKEARKGLQKSLSETTSLSDKLRIQKAIEALDGLPAKLVVIEYKNGCSFTEGGCEYTFDELTKGTDRSFGCNLIIANTSQKEILQRDSLIKRARMMKAKDDTGRVYPAQVAIEKTPTPMPKDFLPGDKSKLYYTINGRPLAAAKEIYFEFPENAGSPFVRVVIPVDALPKLP